VAHVCQAVLASLSTWEGLKSRRKNGSCLGIGWRLYRIWNFGI